MNTDTTPPATSGAAPADLREALKWCADALKGFARDQGILRSSSLTLEETGETKSLKQILADADAALASREAAQPASPAPLTDESPAVDLWAEIWRLREAVKGPEGYDSWQDAATAERIRRVKAEAALASPQVAPAPANEWNDAIEAAAKRIENGSFLHDKSPAKLFANEVAPVLRSMKRAAPTQPGAAADDARDAARYRWLRDQAKLNESDGGISGAWSIRGIDAFCMWVDAPPFNHKTFDGAVDAAMSTSA